MLYLVHSLQFNQFLASSPLTLWCLPERPPPASDKHISAMPYSVLMVGTPLDRSPRCESSDASLSTIARQMVKQCDLTSQNPTVKVTWSELGTNLSRSWAVQKLRSSFFLERKACHLLVYCSKCDSDRVTMATMASKIHSGKFSWKSDHEARPMGHTGVVALMKCVRKCVGHATVHGHMHSTKKKKKKRRSDRRGFLRRSLAFLVWILPRQRPECYF